MEDSVSLDVVTDYISEARILLQDVAQPYRYPDADLIQAFSIAIMESRKLRPDMWLGVTTLPAFYGLMTSADNPIGTNILHFPAVPSAIVAGMAAYDMTTLNAIASTNSVAVGTPNTVVLVNNLTADVPAGDTILFAPSLAVNIDPQYRMPFVYFICANTQMRDEESTEDARAANFMQMWKQAMVAL